MITHESEPFNSADEAAVETLIRTSFEGLAADLDLDVASLVSAGTASGQRLRRRRRVWGIGAVVSIAVIAAAGAVVVQRGVFDHSVHQVAQRPVQQLVPSSSRAQVAALIDHLPAGLSPTRWFESGPSSPTAIGASATTRWGGSITHIKIGAQRDVNQGEPLNCNGLWNHLPPSPVTCELIELPARGSARLEIDHQRVAGKDVSETFDLIIRRPGVETSLKVDLTGMAPSQTAAINRTVLRAVNDQALGLTTYPGFVDAAWSVPGWTPYVRPAKTTVPSR